MNSSVTEPGVLPPNSMMNEIIYINYPAGGPLEVGPAGGPPGPGGGLEPGLM